MLQGRPTSISCGVDFVEKPMVKQGKEQPINEDQILAIPRQYVLFYLLDVWSIFEDEILVGTCIQENIISSSVKFCYIYIERKNI